MCVRKGCLAFCEGSPWPYIKPGVRGLHFAGVWAQPPTASTADVGGWWLQAPEETHVHA